MEKIFIIVPTLIGHGEERMAALAAEVLQKKYDVALIIFSKANQQYFPDCRIVDLNVPTVERISGKIINVFRRAYLIKKLRLKEKPSAVISLGTSANFANILSRGTGKSIISFRGYATVKKGLSFILSCAFADKIFCISRDLKKQLITILPWAEKKTSVIYNRIDMDAIDKLKNEECSFNPQKPSFVSVGRLEHVKGQDHLLRAFKIVSDKIDSATLTFIGDGTLKSELVQLADDLLISDKVFFLGAKKNPFKYMRKCDVCVQTSISEGFLNVLVEAFACDVPVISTDCRSGPREILSETTECIRGEGIQYEKYGILVPSFEKYGSDEPQKEMLLASAMEQLVTNSDLYSKYKEIVRQRAGDFSVEAYFRDLDRIIGE